MAYEEITRHGWLSRIGASFKGILAGAVILAVAVSLQFWNEGRTVKREQALSEGRAQVLESAGAQPDAANDGRLVHVAGRARAGAPLADETFGVEHEALALRRQVQMFQWRERRDTREEKEVGGGTRKVTRYSYETVWDDEPIDSDDFREEEAHRNPDEMPYRDYSWRAADIRIGGFRLGDEAASQIGGWQDLPAAQVQLPENLAAIFRPSGDWFVTCETPAQPQVGDLRVRFQIVPEGAFTVIGRQQAGMLDTWRSSRGQELLIVESGEHGAAALFDEAASDNTSASWALRLAGFVLGWIGFGLLLRPLAVLADVVPILGRLVGFGLALVSGLLAAVLSLVAIGSGWVFYRPWLLAVIVIVVVALIAWLVMRRSRRSVTVPPMPAPAPAPSRPPPPPGA
ncbi:TMEM43 family protein [Chiayiivirga flava]|uniref:Uncharacterized protein n=1 Tax=Chiayiivirga flava TaxID=659595 RepID=A0A7W8FZZ2_9GAMM|nr:TMEM43 family protein [Chiayiivirga flava]MBB5207158.1 hypothetical protein [Chiayiivirga flava]